ncbi:hypothetical protein PsorP6_018862 [Peronosclerospora sorghi]|nr:hypothetical protein PsorP6_018862 [Peronosclerospora sorghi]
MLTTPRSLVKSSTKDLSFPIFEITNQPTLRHQYLIDSRDILVKKKRELFPGLTLASPGSVVLPHIIHVSDRLTRVQLLITRNLSPLQSSKFAFEYLLLPPRSALKAVSLRLTPRASSRPTRPPTH